MKTKDLLENRAEVAKQIKELGNKITLENRDLDQAEQTAWNELNNQFDTLTADIEKAKKVERADSLLNAVAEKPIAKSNDKAIEAWFKRAAGIPLTADHKANASACGVNLNSKVFNFRLWNTDQIQYRDNLVSIGAKGGYLVEPGFIPSIEKALKFFGGVRECYRVVRTDSGNPLDWPTTDDSLNRSGKISEAGSFSATDLAFGSVRIDAYKYYSYVKVSNELLEDSNFASEIGCILGERMARGINYDAINSAAAPEGLLSAVVQTVNRNAANQVKAVDVFAMEGKVDPAYRNGAKWMMSDSAWQNCRQASAPSGDYILQPFNLAADATDRRLLGYPVVINNDLPALGTKGDCCFAQWNQIILREVKEVKLKVLTERFADSDMTAFAVIHRWDVAYLNTSATTPIVLLN